MGRKLQNIPIECTDGSDDRFSCMYREPVTLSFSSQTDLISIRQGEQVVALDIGQFHAIHELLVEKDLIAGQRKKSNQHADLIKRLRENIIADAYADHSISNGTLAERLIRERHAAADALEQL